ncbi:GTP cyclohydrolase [Fervidicella metallireducens AeB]|uniref:GTP cyclohydrolase FolE2 n=1 Tax=Fervidicella metallireducens AeB TaxID=1403537 RepID=A0A017RXF4_9CLOT|nr:GTP cyclohydrolase FolE2 [Fervidicella metallireducens]EYE89377.1 GTP cyclohydrolase [Fervidicella metallireducens AeB]
MKDVQNEKDIRNVQLKKVGIKNLKWPIVAKDRTDGVQHTVAELALSVELPHDVRGTHMSRFVEIMSKHNVVSPKDLEVMLDELKEKLEAEVAHCTVVFDYFVKKPSPVTGIVSPYDVKCTFDAEKGEKFKFTMEVAVPVSTLCPCSKEISEFGAHNQRATVYIKVEMNKMIWIEDIVKIAEDSASTPVFSLLKRKDEKWITEQAYLNPRFVEDVAREAAIRLEQNEKISWYSVYVESMESIHNHNAFAYTEKGCML